MIWKYGIFCAILSGSVWGTFWQVILTILAILTTGLQLSLEIAPALFSGASIGFIYLCLLYTSPSPRDPTKSRMPSSA